MLRDCINDCLLKGPFPDSLKLANVKPFHKKDEPTDKENYRPASILPLLSKIFERLIYNQLNEYLDQYLKVYRVVLGKLIPLNMLYLDFYKNGKMN